jgi:hypothetical protein
MSKVKTTNLTGRTPSSTLTIGEEGSTTAFHPASTVLLDGYATDARVDEILAGDVSLDGVLTKDEAQIVYQQVFSKGAPNGYAPLNDVGKVPVKYMNTDGIEIMGTYGTDHKLPDPNNQEDGDAFICNTDGYVDEYLPGITSNSGDIALDLGNIYEHIPSSGGAITADEVIETDSRAFVRPDDISNLGNEIDTKVDKSGDTITGALNIQGANLNMKGNAGTTNMFLGSSGDITAKVINANGKINAHSSIDMNDTKITNLGDPTGAQHAATRSYVDTEVGQKADSNNPVITGKLIHNGSESSTSVGVITEIRNSNDDVLFQVKGNGKINTWSGAAIENNYQLTHKTYVDEGDADAVSKTDTNQQEVKGNLKIGGYGTVLYNGGGTDSILNKAGIDIGLDKKVSKTGDTMTGELKVHQTASEAITVTKDGTTDTFVVWSSGAVVADQVKVVQTTPLNEDNLTSRKYVDDSIAAIPPSGGGSSGPSPLGRPFKLEPSPGGNHYSLGAGVFQMTTTNNTAWTGTPSSAAFIGMNYKDLDGRVWRMDMQGTYAMPEGFVQLYDGDRMLGWWTYGKYTLGFNFIDYSTLGGVLIPISTWVSTSTVAILTSNREYRIHIPFWG